MSEKLRFFDPQLKEKPEQELFNEPEWLTELRQLDGQIRVRRESWNCSCFCNMLVFCQVLKSFFPPCQFRSCHLILFLVSVLYPAVFRLVSYSTVRKGRLLHSSAPAAPVLSWTSKVHLNQTPSPQILMAPCLIIH